MTTRLIKRVTTVEEFIDQASPATSTDVDDGEGDDDDSEEEDDEGDDPQQEPREVAKLRRHR